MVRLIDDLLDVSRVSRGTFELRKERVELQSIVHLAVEAIRAICHAEQQKLTLDLPPEPLRIEADPVRLAQIIGNLLSNACRYSNTGAEIVIRASLEAGGVVVSVKDRGIGIPPDKLETIFEMFSQIDRSLERTTGGLGIGLYLVDRLVEMHGGTVTAHSEGPGKGSEFILRLPVLAQPSVVIESTAPPKTDARKPSARRRHVLVVDDNKDAARTTATLLAAHGYVTETALDGLQAVEAAERFNPELILLDIGLPRLNGYEVCQRIRQQPWGSEMVFIALTGWGKDEDRRRAEESGFDAHLVKPVEPLRLLELLASLLKEPDQSRAPATLNANSS
jgi:CheY-like chemotaxis protein